MILKKIIKVIKCIFYFKRPLKVIDFYRGKIKKGVPVKIEPRNGDYFYIARMGDLWLLDKIINGGKVRTKKDDQGEINYLSENGILLRQGTSDTFVYKEIFFDKCYYNEIKELRSSGVVVDIGAHIGLFSIYASPTCEKIYAYEANKENYDLATKNIQNKNINNVILNNLAVWSSSGKTLELSDGGAGQTGEHTIGSRKGKNVFRVNSISINDIFFKNSIKYCDLLKMDIEGAEYVSLFSVSNEIFSRIGSISMEYHLDVLNKNTVEDLIGLLKGKGFTVNKKEINNSVGLLYAKK